MGVSIGWYIFLGITLVGLIGLVIWLLTEVFREKPKQYDKTIGINFCSHLPSAKGRFIGDEESAITGKDGRKVITLSPKDVDVNLDQEEIENVSVVVGGNKRLVMSKGFPSKDRNISIYLPPNAEDFPEEFKETALGKAFMWLTELKNYEKLVTDVVREGSDRKDVLLKKIGDGEISKEFIQFQEGLVTDYLKSILTTKDDKKQGLNLGGTNPGG